VCFDPNIDEEVIDGVVNRIGNGRLLDGPKREGVSEGEQASIGRIQDAWKSDAGVKAIALHPPVIAALRQLYGRKPLPFQTLNFRVGTEQKAHSDTIHFNSIPSGFMCGVWTALEDIDDINGAVEYWPGSHKLGEINMQDVYSAPDLGAQKPEPIPPAGASAWVRSQIRRLRGYPPNQDYGRLNGLYEQFIERRLGTMGIEPRLAMLRKGHCFFWAANLLHGGSPRHDRRRTRHSQVTHYFFDECRYHRPLLNANGKVYEFAPELIA
jgi:ectoine hydroxylase-related dioxygenase (phytanoyl-CoA dioxygenase family)